MDASFLGMSVPQRNGKAAEGEGDGVRSAGADDSDRGKKRGLSDEDDEITSNSRKIRTQTLETRKDCVEEDGTSHPGGVNETGHA